MKLEKSLFLYFSVILFSCASSILTNRESYKRITYPGLATEKPFVTYIVDFESNSDFSISDVKLNNITVQFVVLSKSDKAYTTALSDLKAGEYSISFKSYEIDDFKNDDVVTLFYETADKAKKKQFIIEKRKPIKRR